MAAWTLRMEFSSFSSIQVIHIHSHWSFVIFWNVSNIFTCMLHILILEVHNSAVVLVDPNRP